MTKEELDKWAKDIKIVLNENTLAWGLTIDTSRKFSLKDLMYLFQVHNISCMKDHRGCVAFTNY